MLGTEERKIKVLKTPVGSVKALYAGDRVIVTGTVYTARDEAHRRLEKEPLDLTGGIIYHCGPLVKDNKVISAGPTTSARMNCYGELYAKLGIKAIIGKGGMSSSLLEIFSRHDIVYLSATGGAGALLASKILRIKGVHFPELGMAESVWVLDVKDFPCIVTMDAHGKSLYR